MCYKKTEDGDTTRSEAPNAKGDNMLNFDMHVTIYAVGINPTHRDYFTANVRGQLYRLAGLSMGWSLLPFYFYKMTQEIMN
jgi:hypothetical protein